MNFQSFYCPMCDEEILVNETQDECECPKCKSKWFICEEVDYINGQYRNETRLRPKN